MHYDMQLIVDSYVCVHHFQNKNKKEHRAEKLLVRKKIT